MAERTGNGPPALTPALYPSPARSPTPTSPRSPSWVGLALQQPSNKKSPSRPSKIFRRMRLFFRSLPIITPVCKFPMPLYDLHGGTRMAGTLFGHRKARVNLSIQESPSSFPTMLLELTIQTGKLLQDMGVGLVRMALECEKKPNEKTKIVDEPIWALHCNGKKSGYGVKREPTDDDLNVMQMLHVVSMGAGVLPSRDGGEQPDGELMYMRAHFERVVGSKDSETYYMMNPDGHNGPELTIFFVRL